MSQEQTFKVGSYKRTTRAVDRPTTCPRCNNTKVIGRFPSPNYLEKIFVLLCDDCEKIILDGVARWGVVSQEYRKLDNAVRGLKRRKHHTPESLRLLRVKEARLARVNQERLEIRELKRYKRTYIDFK